MMLSHEQDQLISKYQTRTLRQYRPLPTPTVKNVLPRNVDKSFTTSASLMVVCWFAYLLYMDYLQRVPVPACGGRLQWQTMNLAAKSFSFLHDTEADHFQN